MALSRAQIQVAFQNSLGRAASASDENSYFSVSQSGALTDAQIFSTISNSREADQIADPVIRFYQAAFGRVPDQAGLQNAENYVRANGPSASTYQMLSNMFAQSTEFTNRFGTGTAVDAAYVQALYSTILGRTATSGEVDGYVNAGTTRGNVLYLVSQSQEAISISDNAVNGFQQNAAQGQAVYTGTLYTAANGQPNNPANNGQTFTLTTNIDNLAGTAGNDTFVGDNNTLTNDVINGGAGTDTLRVTTSGALSGVPTINNVERIEVSAFSSGSTLNLANATGVQTLASVNGSNNVVFSNVKAIANAEITGTTAGSLNIGYNADVVAGAADVQNVALNGSTTSTFTINGIETVNIAGTGNSTIATLNGTTLATVNISGAGNTTITNPVETTVTTVNASTATGNVTVALGNSATVVTGGSGNDKFIFGANLGAGDTVTGGAGTDTVSITGAVITAGATLTALNNRVTGVEVLEFTGTDATTITGGTGADAFTNTGITKILFNTSGAGVTDTVELAGARTYAFGTLNAGAATFNSAQGQNTLNLSFEGSSTANAAVGTITETALSVNIDSSGTFATGANTATGIASANNTSITITGAKALDLGTLSVATTTAGAAGDTINATGFTGKLTLVGSSGTDIVNVGSGGSVISGSASSDTYNLGGGRDQLKFTGADNANLTTGLSTTAANSLDTVSSFTAGQDKIVLATAITGINSVTVTGQASLTDTIASSTTLFGNGNNAAVVTVTGTNAGTYLVANTTTTVAEGDAASGFTAADFAIKLVGLSGTLTTADFATTVATA
jgi:hypothetical protein